MKRNGIDSDSLTECVDCKRELAREEARTRCDDCLNDLAPRYTRFSPNDDVDDTGFANGGKWESAEQVREYFTHDNFESMFGPSFRPAVEEEQINADAAACGEPLYSESDLAAISERVREFDDETLRSWAEFVITRRSHCAFDADATQS